jgi:hypothetical protein
MGFFYDEETGEVGASWERKYISKDEALKMWPNSLNIVRGDIIIEVKPEEKE